MTPETLQLLIGPSAALVGAIFLLYCVATRKFFAPMPYLDAAEKRVALLETEAVEKNNSLKELTRSNTDLLIEVTRLGSEVSYLREEVATLRGSSGRGPGAG